MSVVHGVCVCVNILELWLVHTARDRVRDRNQDGHNRKQECIPVGCVPPSHWPYSGGGSAWGVSAQEGCLPGGVSPQGVCLPRGMPARGVCPGLSAKGGGVSAQGACVMYLMLPVCCPVTN